MEMSIITGIINGYNGTNYDCWSGTCTWQSYETLGICSRCVDLSQQLTIKCKTQSSSSDELVKVCTYRFPDASENDPNGRFEPEVTWRYWPHAQGHAISPSTVLNNSVAFSETSIAVVDRLKFHKTWYDFQESTWDALDRSIIPLAERCNLTWCQQSHTGSKCENGALLDWPASTKDLAYGKCRRAAVASESDFIYPLWPAHEPKPPVIDCKTLYSQDPHDAYWTKIIADSSIFYALKATLSTRGRNFSGDSGPYWPAMAMLMYNNEFSQTLDYVAASMTNRLRAMDFAYVVEGKVKIQVTHVHVNWYWFAYPAAMVLLVAVFLIVSIVFSSKRGGIVWKSSLLPLLLCGLKGYEQHEEQVRLKDLEEEAREMQAWFAEQDGGGLCLRFSAPESDRALQGVQG